jgi:hypothetical protein
VQITVTFGRSKLLEPISPELNAEKRNSVKKQILSPLKIIFKNTSNFSDNKER